jgi:hypothetical protein
MSDAKSPAGRFTGARLRILLEEARAIPGAQVKVDLKAGTATIHFPADGKPLDNAEGERLEEAMNAAIPSARKAGRGA